MMDRKAGKRDDKMSADDSSVGYLRPCHHLLNHNQAIILVMLLVLAADLSLVLYRSAYSNYSPSSRHFSIGQENVSSSSGQDGGSKVEGDSLLPKVNVSIPGDHPTIKGDLSSSESNFSSPTQDHSTLGGDTSAPSSSSTSAQSSNGNQSSTESVQGHLSPLQVNQENEETKLKRVLSKAATADKTIIFTTINAAWTSPGSLFDLFLEGFRIGNQTQHLLNHLVIVAVDQKAYSHCLKVHQHCYALITEGVDFSGRASFMSPQYLKMMWRRLDFMRTILELGYNFIFTDTDIIWFRDPFPHFYEDADFQIASDQYQFTSTDLRNRPNAGFIYVRSNNITLQFYKFWYGSKETYPGKNEQDVFNIIKFDRFIEKIGLKIRFLDTDYFGGFCQPSKDLNVVCTMHANCCVGVHKKIHDLQLVIDDWKKYMASPKNRKRRYSWTQRNYCV